MFKWKGKYKATNAIFLEYGNGKEGRPFKARFLQAGLVKYDFGVCLLKKETIDKFINTFVECPVIIDHKDDIASSDIVGTIKNIWFSAEDGWFWCDGVITDEKAIKLIEDGYNVSCQYRITDYSENAEGKLHNANPYDKEILDGVFEHLAIVENPRYEDAFIAVNAYIATNKDTDMDDDVEWITVRGTHIPVKKGQSKQEAIESHWGKTNEENNAKEKQKDSSERLNKIISSELPEAREELSLLKTEIRRKSEKGEMTQELRRELNKKENKLEQKIESLKKEAEQLRYGRDKYTEKYQPIYSTDKEHREKVAKVDKETDWNQFHKDSLLGKNPNYKTDLKQIIKKAKENPELQQKVNIGKVSAKLQKIAKENGFDISGYSHNLDVSGTRHTIKGHSNEKAEENRGQIAITDEDFERIPEIIYDYDDVSFGEKDNKGTPLIKYKKTFQDGRTIYVEEIRNRQKTLTIKTMYKTKKASNSRTFTDFNPQRQEYTSTIILTYNSDDFNPNVTINKAVNKFKPVFDYIRKTEGEPMDNETKGLFAALADALKARNEAEDEKEKEKQDPKASNEDVDKRKLIDEIGGILKGKVDEELWRTIIGKAEKIAYDKSESGTADNSKAKNEEPEPKKDDEPKNEKEAQNRCKNEDDRDYKSLYEELKAKVDEEAANKKAKNALDETVNKLYSALVPEQKDLYISPEKGLELGKQIYG